MKKVLIAIDYNPVSEKVAEEGYKLAKLIGAEVCLLHALGTAGFYEQHYPAFLGYSGYAGMPADLSLVEEMQKNGEEYLKSAARHLRDPNIKTHLEEGDAGTIILEFSKQYNADVIVMGTHSHSVLEKLLMGTVASKVLEKTEIPVYLVPVKKNN